MSTSLSVFVNGVGLIPSGINGVATIVYRLTGVPAGLMVFILCAVITIAGWIFLGRGNFGRTIFAIAVLSVWLEVSARLFPAFSGNVWVSAMLGGLFVGVGLGIVLKNKGSLGTTDLIAMILNKYFRINAGASIMVMDVIPILLGGLVLHAGMLFPSILYLAVLSLVILVINPKAEKKPEQKQGPVR